MTITALAMAGNLLRIAYLAYPFAVLLIAVLPLVGSAFSQRFGIIYLNGQILYDTKWPLNKNKKVIYSLSNEHCLSRFNLKEIVFHTLINIFGMLYVIYAMLQYFFPSLADPNLRFVAILLLMLPCLVMSSALNVSVSLFRMIGFTYNDKVDGERKNFGKEMRSKFGRIIGIGAAVLFGYMFFKSPADIGSGIAAILFVILICTPPTIFSYYLMNRRGFEKSKKEFRQKLVSHVE
jgi:hypothetical protein